MSARQAATDAEVVASMATATDRLWPQLFALQLWTRHDEPSRGDVDALVGLLGPLGLVVPFDWPAWHSSERYRHGHGLEAAPVADAVRLVTAHVRGERFSDGVLLGGLRDGSLKAAVQRLWQWYRQAVVGHQEFVDRADYSADRIYRWSYERRWAPGGSLCWVGLNPGKGDEDLGPRPTLRKVVGWAKREGCAAVTVVNLFSFRSTDPKALRGAGVDAVGEETDAAVRAASRDAQVTLAAWGADPLARRRAAEVTEMLVDPRCAGVTKSGEPRHPLYVAAATPFTPYRRT